jgi:hypothetical protein
MTNNELSTEEAKIEVGNHIRNASGSKIVLLVTLLLSPVVAAAQTPNVNAKPTQKIRPDNKAKPLPTPSNGMLIPKLKLVRIDGTDPTKQFNIGIANWDKFPPEVFKPDSSLPPSSCDFKKLHARLSVTLIRKDDGKSLGCAVVTAPATDTFSFRTYDGTNPEIYAIFLDLKTGTKYKSTSLSTATK